MAKIILNTEGDVYKALLEIKRNHSLDDWKKGKEEYIKRSGNIENAVNYMANRYCYMYVNGGNGDLIRILEEKIARQYERN